MPSGYDDRPTAFIFLVNSHSKKSLFLLTMGVAGRLPGKDRKISSGSSTATSCDTPAAASFWAKLLGYQSCSHRSCTSRCGNSGRNPVAAVFRQEGRPVSRNDVLVWTTVPAHTSATPGHTDLHNRPSRPFLRIFPSNAVAEW